jgi:hypothetical protein
MVIAVKAISPLTGHKANPKPDSIEVCEGPRSTVTKPANLQSIAHVFAVNAQPFKLKCCALGNSHSLGRYSLKTEDI